VTLLQSVKGRGFRSAAVYGVAATAIAAAGVLLYPPVNLQTPHRFGTVAIATVAVLVVIVLGAYALVRFPHRKHWPFWAGLALASLLALGAALVKYNADRSLYSVEVDGKDFVVGTERDLTSFGKLSPRITADAMLRRTAFRPELAWEPAALQRYATRLERLYYGCESLVALSVIAMIGAWRARAVRAITPTSEIAPAAHVPAAKARRRFRIALSFPGDVRDRAERIADVLARTLGKDAVFYDRWYRAELARPNLDLYLQSIYKVESDLLVILLCAEYEQKEWCGLEWRVVRDLIKGRESERIMFLRLDEAPIEGLLSIDGYLDVVMLRDEEVAEAILTRIRGATMPSSNHAR
jgi:TIR domain